MKRTYDVLSDVELPPMLLLAVTVAAVDHDLGRKACLDHLVAAVAHVLGGVVGPARAAAEDDMDVGIALGVRSASE